MEFLLVTQVKPGSASGEVCQGPWLCMLHCLRFILVLEKTCSQEETKGLRLLQIRLVDALRARSRKELEPHIAYLVVIGRTVRLWFGPIGLWWRLWSRPWLSGVVIGLDTVHVTCLRDIFPPLFVLLCGTWPLGESPVAEALSRTSLAPRLIFQVIGTERKFLCNTSRDPALYLGLHICFCFRHKCNNTWGRQVCIGFFNHTWLDQPRGHSEGAEGPEGCPHERSIQTHETLANSYILEYGRKYWHYFAFLIKHPKGWLLLNGASKGMFFVYW